MKKKDDFEIIISSKKSLPKSKLNNLAEMIFSKLPTRSENSCIILSHDDEVFIKINLKKYRFIVASIIKKMNEKNIKPGDTVLLGTFSVNSEYIIALLFSALVSYGVRVLLPMFVETSEVYSWMQKTNCKFIIIPITEIMSKKEIHREKKIIENILSIGKKKDVLIYDIDEDFNIRDLVFKPIPGNFSVEDNKLVRKSIDNTNLKTESVIFTTSGTSGKSKLIVYEQGAFIRSCISWQESGFFDKNKLGGKNLIDIFTHTISIRAFINSIWAGSPICIIKTDWLKRKPEKTLPILIKMKFEGITGSPSHMNAIIDFIDLFPELKQIVFPKLKTAVCTGAKFNKSIAKRWLDISGKPLHNAYGTSETQQVLSTLLCSDDSLCKTDMPLGQPLCGVGIGLLKYDNKSYKIYVKSPFGHKYIIDEHSGEKIFPDNFYYTGDIVRLDENDVFYIGREKTDFFKGCFGAKVPVSYIQNYYKDLYKQILHIEYYVPVTNMLSHGLSALILIKDKSFAYGRVTNKKIIKRYAKIIRKINKSLLKKLEPFEYEYRTINKFLLINTDLKKTFKGTIPKNEIEIRYKNEINELINSKKQKSGVTIIYTTRLIILSYLYRLLLNNPIIRKYILKIYLRFKRN